jgi:hypothetical protein
MSSTALTLVNRVLAVTGDYKSLTTISGSPAGIGARIVEFLNLTIGDVEKRTNFPFLRVNSQGTGDGTNDIFVFSGTEDVRFGGAVSVWLAQNGVAKELTPSQFDAVVASPNTTSASTTSTDYYFQRGVDATTNKLTIQLYPTPPTGVTINITAHKKATRLDSATDTSVTEIDDDVLVYGALMHMDAYDGMDRGYSALYKNHLDEYVMEFYANRDIQITMESYN